MGRRRWRVITIAAFLLFMIKDTQCQDENEFYYTPVERNFAQVQPPLFPNSRPTTYFDNGDNYRVAPTAQQPLFNEGHVRFPSPNYNQNPSPFQLPTGRSQSGTPYYLNQAEFGTPQRTRFRPALPYNFELHPASTKRPTVPQIHSVAYQNDPSKPETFLGQITLNNPDIDYLQNNRFKNIPFDSNSLKSNGQSGHIPHDEDIDDNQDIFEHHRVTTYNPNKLVIKQRLNIKPTNSSKLKNYDPSFLDDKINFQNTPNKLYVNNDRLKLNTANSQTKQDTSNENKAIHDLEPLLEDDISDISSFRELMKNNQGSFDVQVIKSNNSGEYAEDNKPDASSMNTDNRSKDVPIQYLRHESVPSSTTVKTTSTTKETVTHHEHDDPQDEETEDEGEYVEYYDDTEITEIKHTTTSKPKDTEEVTDIYDDYDTTEVPENPDGEEKENEKESFDVLVMKTNKTMVQDDNFKHFVDSTEIDATETSKNNSNKLTTRVAIPNEDIASIETPILRQEVVSVVTTKSVVNGTISIPDVTFAPSTSKIDTSSESSLTLTNNDNNTSVTTENWIVVASVQTSRSVSGARFLPFPTVEQEEKKQVLTDETDESGDYIEETVTKDSKLETVGIINSSSSTENLNDKLDTIQSELSSSVLTGSLNKENKNIELITESTTESTTTSTTTTTTTTTTPSSLNVFTLKSTQNPNTTEKSSPDPLPVLIKKFAPRITTSSTSTTPKPRKKPSFVTVMDDLAGFLPPGYKPRPSYKDKRTSTTSTTQKTRISTTARTTTTTTAIPESSSTEDTILNGTQGRSSGISFKNKVIVLDDKSLLPKEYKPKENEAPESLLKKIQNDDLSKFLPPGYKPPEEPETVKEDIFDKIKTLDISAFLPKGYNLTSSTTEKPKTEIKIPIKAATVDLSALLPPGFKLNSENVTTEKAIIEFKVPDISNLLPPGFSLNKTDEKTDSSDSSGENAKEATSSRAPGGSKLVFPTRLGAKPIRKNTTPKSGVSVGPDPVTPKILKGWPVRASTEFTGWPSPSTTPFSIEKLLEAQRNATATSPMPEASTEFTTRRSTTTTSTTTITPPPPTTPGICRKECDIAATIKIVSGVKWVPELLDHHTEEWQKLAKEVKNELNSVYSNSDDLNKWYKDIRIEGFTKGSVLVDYFIELNDVDEKVDTLQLKKLFHKSLNQASPGSVVEIIEQPEVLDPDVMLGDQPEEERMSKSNEKMTKTIDKSAGKLEIGKFVMDPAYTEFIVLPKRQEPTMVAPDEESFLPQWGIAVIVIALASLLFVVIFGVTVLVNRQKSAKAKQPIPLSEDMLRELDKSHMGGFDDLHQMKERELPYLPSGKRMSTAFIEQLAYPNPGDSWRSEWTPQLQKYMQHYTPDSGRGSQIYGQAGNGYGYGGGSQIYGQTGGGSQVYGYTGEYPVPRSHYSRRRSEYDSNF